MAWRVLLSGTSGRLTIGSSDNADFSISGTATHDSSGETQMVTTVIRVYGDLVQPSDTALADRMLLWLDQVAKSKGTMTVQLELNSVVKREWIPANCYGSPVVDFFETRRVAGDGESHWDVSLGITIRQGIEAAAGGGGGSDAPVAYSGEITTVKNTGGDIIKKIWRMTATAKTAAKAAAFVLGFKPAAVRVEEELTRGSAEQSATVTWVYDAQRDETGIIRVVEEPIRMVGLGHPWFPTYRVGGLRAVFHRGRRREGVIVVSGRIESYTAPIPSMPYHFNDADDMKLQNTTSNYLDTTEFDRDRGIWVRPFHEEWIYTGDAIPVPTHSGHNDKLVLTEPEDGKLLTYTRPI